MISCSHLKCDSLRIDVDSGSTPQQERVLVFLRGFLVSLHLRGPHIVSSQQISIHFPKQQQLCFWCCSQVMFKRYSSEVRSLIGLVKLASDQCRNPREPQQTPILYPRHPQIPKWIRNFQIPTLLVGRLLLRLGMFLSGQLENAEFLEPGNSLCPLWVKWPFQRLSDLQRSGIKRAQIESFGKKYHIFPSLLLMEKSLHHLGCPKCWFYTSFKAFWGIPSGAGFQPSTVTSLISFVKSLPWETCFIVHRYLPRLLRNIWFLHIQ